MDAAKAAAALLSARQSHTALAALPEGLPQNATLADGYAVQDAMISAADKGALSGWKVRKRAVGHTCTCFFVVWRCGVV